MGESFCRQVQCSPEGNLFEGPDAVASGSSFFADWPVFPRFHFSFAGCLA
jgi:hypothetical protein